MKLTDSSQLVQEILYEIKAKYSEFRLKNNDFHLANNGKILLTYIFIFIQKSLR